MRFTMSSIFAFEFMQLCNETNELTGLLQNLFPILLMINIVNLAAASLNPDAFSTKFETDMVLNICHLCK